jgi:hypothetical protein
MKRRPICQTISVVATATAICARPTTGQSLAKIH